jgi:hypothetical protein
LPDNHAGPCPKCGKTGKHVVLEPLKAFLKPTGKLKLIRERRQEIKKKNPKVLWIINGISIASILFGIAFPPVGSVLGIIALLAANFLGPQIIHKIIIERDKS